MCIKIDLELKPWNKYTFNDVTVYFAGHINIQGGWFQSGLAAKELLSYIGKCSDLECIMHELKDIYGQFAFIIDFPEKIIVSVDKIRSLPLYYYEEAGGGVIFTNNPAILNLRKNKDINNSSLLEFEMAGYTLGKKTLFKCLNQVTAGQCLIYEKESNELSISNYFRYFSNEIVKFNSKSEKLKAIDSVINRSILNVIEIANGRQIVIPLSAGYDSRLILAKLVEQGYRNIICYTYGTKNLWEIKKAKKSAEMLNIPWYFVRFNKETKYLFSTEDRKKYYLNSSGYNSIPHLADYYALAELLRNKKIKTNSLIINGQAGDFITGGHIQEEIKNDNFSIDKAYDKIIYKHFALWIDILQKVSNKEYILKQLEDNIKLYNTDSNEILAKKLDYFEYSERQCKYVINGQRAYDWLGLDWYLPLWSNAMLEFWPKLSIEDKIYQNSYIEYCEVYNPMGIFSLDKKPNKTNSLPLLIYFIKKMFSFLDRISDKFDSQFITRKYLSFYDKYFPYYPQLTLKEFTKDSENHRHCVSYWVKYFIDEIQSTFYQVYRELLDVLLSY